MAQLLEKARLGRLAALGKLQGRKRRVLTRARVRASADDRRYPTGCVIAMKVLR
ncbi:hypothetical protein [Frigidibacter sp. SD6-1]|uniref:hypothetical protein n=1 Tax=Frigidibacter sp. SD6-1 TaxID=3032581 RepID=UPI0024E03155|nr:hypothetical protein [Frigidibacter sp. SD6-1]